MGETLEKSFICIIGPNSNIVYRNFIFSIYLYFLEILSFHNVPYIIALSIVKILVVNMQMYSFYAIVY